MTAPIPPKLGSLLRLLASNSDGEVLAAVAAIKRSLAASGHDFHALAEALTNGGKIPQEDMQRLYDAGLEAGKAIGFKNGQLIQMAKQDAAKRPEPIGGFSHVNGSTSTTWYDIAVYCHNRPQQHRGDRESDFILDMTKRASMYTLTERQADWLRSIYLRCGGDPSDCPEN